jgi:hypothetical protein
MRHLILHLTSALTLILMTKIATVYAQSDDEVLLAYIAQASQCLLEDKQKAAELERMGNQPTKSPEARKQAAETLSALKTSIAETETLLQKPMPSSTVERKEYARLIAGAVARQQILTGLTERRLGVAPNSRIERVLDTNLEDYTKWASKGFDGTASSFNPNPDDVVVVPQTDFFSISSMRRAVEAGNLRVTSSYVKSTKSTAEAFVARYGQIPGGVTVEGVATEVGQVSQVVFDNRHNALVLDDRLVYFLKIPPWSAAALCRSIAHDDQSNDPQHRHGGERIGVSMTGTKNLLFGELERYENTELATDLLMTDSFLGDIVFHKDQWTRGYNLPHNTTLQSATVTGDMAVTFTFGRFKFQIHRGELRATNASLEIEFFPVSTKKTVEGGLLPDLDLLSKGYTPPPGFVANAKLVTTQIGYFRRERLVEMVFAYGEAAAVFRALKISHVDLDRLTHKIETGTDS